MHAVLRRCAAAPLLRSRLPKAPGSESSAADDPDCFDFSFIVESTD
jgi:hypothetical protein